MNPCSKSLVTNVCGSSVTKSRQLGAVLLEPGSINGGRETLCGHVFACASVEGAVRLGCVGGRLR